MCIHTYIVDIVGRSPENYCLYGQEKALLLLTLQL